MRELKFRVWEKGKMVYSDDFYMSYEFFEQACLDENKAMIFTGVKDKNGKKIYEGDVVSYKGLNGVVSFIAGMFVLDYDDQTDSGPIGFLRTEDMEIVGNVFEKGINYEQN